MGKITLGGKTITKPFTYNGKKVVKLTMGGKVLTLKSGPVDYLDPGIYTGLSGSEVLSLLKPGKYHSEWISAVYGRPEYKDFDLTGKTGSYTSSGTYEVYWWEWQLRGQPWRKGHLTLTIPHVIPPNWKPHLSMFGEEMKAIIKGYKTP